MAGRGRRGSSAAWAGQRRQHVEQVGGHRFVAGWGPRRSASVVPAPLRYWQYEPPRPRVFALAAAIVAGWLALFGWGGGWAGVRGEIPWAVGTALLVLVLDTTRTVVSDWGLSTDTAGTRPDPARVVALAQVREVRTGRPPADWPATAHRGRWWPGRTRVAVRHLADDGGEQTRTLWARDPEALAEALDSPL